MGYVEELRKIVGHRPLILVGAVVLVINENIDMYYYNKEQSLTENGGCLVD